MDNVLKSTIVYGCSKLKYFGGSVHVKLGHRMIKRKGAAGEEEFSRNRKLLCMTPLRQLQRYSAGYMR
jgi:hypothetical protein